MGDPSGEAEKSGLRLDFDRRLLLQFRGSTITSDAGLLAYRELDDALRLTDTGANTLADVRTGKNGRHRLAGLLRQSVFGRLAGYEDVNDAERLCRDPAMRWVVGDRAIAGFAASASQIGRFETKWLSRQENLAALADLPGQWIGKVHQHCTSFSIPIAICCRGISVASALRSARSRLWPAGTRRSPDPLHRGPAGSVARDTGMDVRCRSLRGGFMRQPEACDYRVDRASGRTRQPFARPARRRIIDLLNDNGGFR